ncbi:excalibur calcium-binding domain-containing protein [Azomonas macrocytogenes]|uniref:excalibur calcium-binding domain-containing protein n=1 Tax=Azomonas macrocytogenes TaxID=69962 RepID=UPI0023DD915C|nr:excalibur calcium-binding domain-containing protein [Azomonas macrocytogenes]
MSRCSGTTGKSKALSSAASGATTPVLATSSTSSPYSCSPRKTCGQMTSCAEARYRLEQCGDHRIDGDNDGTPCEALCK